MKSTVVFPGEWEQHYATWLAWPHNRETFYDLPAVEETWVKMISAIAEKEKVQLLVNKESMNAAVSRVGELSNVLIHQLDTADVWLRDTGPIFVKNPYLTATCWRFNAWGEKYSDLLGDVGLNLKVAELSGIPPEPEAMVLEGGSIDSNGAGLCLTSEQCLLNRNRNPKMTKEQIEARLKAKLGFEQVLWLGEGIQGDDTDGHVDDLARFVNRKTVLHAMTYDDKDPNYRALADNRNHLKRFCRDHGLEAVPLPAPPALKMACGPLPASYCNFYICNSSVLVPTFGVKTDDEALDVVKQFFKTRKVIGIDCRKLVEGFGVIHCVTQQQPV
ncbi:agmatine deiminase family protein [Candidatus Micrarchaeota archaeon]|nr:agmatine deiminase family protein [Candidatus Micrarchaeota archaeon]